MARMQEQGACTFLEDGLAAPLDAGFADAVLAGCVADWVLTFASAAAFAAVCTRS